MTMTNGTDPDITDTGWIPRLVYRVALDDGRQWVVDTDQRDQRRAMVTCGLTDPTADPLGFSFAVTWSALTRTGELPDMGWAEYQSRVVGVMPLEAEPATVDPTGTAGAD